ncbi:MAG: LysR family transcriptional regulator, partial [Pseudomonadota bacterium]
LGWFRAFESAANHQSFTAAAEELGMTQSAVSQQIRSLESRLGCRLFERKPRGIALTDDARKLLPDVRRAIDMLHSATAPYQQQQAGLLTIATSVSVAQWYIAPHLHAFTAQHPHLDVRLMTTVWPDTLADATDVQIRFGASQGQAALGANRLVLVAAPGLLGGESLPLATHILGNYPLIQAVGTSDTWSHCAGKFDIADISSSMLYVDSHGLAVDLARAGSGIALTSELIALPLLTTGELLQVSPMTPDAEDGYYVSVRRGGNADAATEFVTWLSTQVNRVKEAFEYQ